MADLPDEPITRTERYLSSIAGRSGTIPDEPITREEMYLAKIAGRDVELPEPISRTEQYFDYIAENGTGGGDITTQTLNVTENGTYTAPAGKAYTPVRVNVQMPEAYSGPYEVESSPFDDTTLMTSGKLMEQDMVVKKIPVAEVSNSSGGYTVTIGR